MPHAPPENSTGTEAGGYGKFAIYTNYALDWDCRAGASRRAEACRRAAALQSLKTIGNWYYTSGFKELDYGAEAPVGTDRWAVRECSYGAPSGGVGRSALPQDNCAIVPH
jgi:hypothetical protein